MENQDRGAGEVHVRYGPSGAVVRRARGELEEVEPEVLLSVFAGCPRGFWERDGAWVAWAGSAREILLPRGYGPDRFAEVRRRAASLERELKRTGEARRADRASGAATFPGTTGPDPLRLYGGFSFRDGGEPGSVWSSFPSARFVLPAVELRGGEERTELRVAVREAPGSGADTAVRTLDRVRRRLLRAAAFHRSPGDIGPAGDVRSPYGSRFPDGRRPAGGTTDGASRQTDHAAVPEGRDGAELRRPPSRELLTREGWMRAVEAALESVRSGRLHKVVLARGVEWRLAAPPDPAAALLRLRRSNPGTFPYLLEFDPGRLFLGAAPEIVAAHRGGRLHATAVAGTVRRGYSDAGSRESAHRLLASEKDRLEHEIGVREMRASLVRAAGGAEVDQEPSVLQLSGMQHLLTNLAAQAPPGMHVLDLLAEMHPTAAVNGDPREAALAFLGRHEPFDRGWYAGPVGWFDLGGEGEFAPALRSAVIVPDRARLFAGAGLVQGSRVEEEWEETTLKLGPAAAALGLTPREETSGPPVRPHGVGVGSNGFPTGG